MQCRRNEETKKHDTKPFLFISFSLFAVQMTVLAVFTSSLVSETACHLVERWFIHARETKIVRVLHPVLPLDWNDFRRKEAVVFISSTLLRRALMTSVGSLDHIGLLILV
jgi:hypothetical protein